MIVTSVEAEITVSATRKKRATTALTCDNLKSMGSAVEQLSTAKLSDLSDEVFSDCLDFLGANARMWSEDQLKILVNKLGDPCTKDENGQSRIGSLAYGLASEKLACLMLGSDSVVQSLGSLSNFTSDQLKLLAKAFMEKRSINSISEIDSTVLTIMSHIIGGLTTDQIAKIKGSVLKETSSIGSLKSIPIEQLKALADLAKSTDAYGPVKNWGAGQHAEAGILVAGLNSDVLKDVRFHNYFMISIIITFQ